MFSLSFSASFLEAAPPLTDLIIFCTGIGIHFHCIRSHAAHSSSAASELLCPLNFDSGDRVFPSRCKLRFDHWTRPELYLYVAQRGKEIALLVLDCVLLRNRRYAVHQKRVAITRTHTRDPRSVLKARYHADWSAQNT